MNSFSAALPDSETIDFENSLLRHPPRSVRLHSELENIADLPFEHGVAPWYPLAKILADSNIRPSQFLNYATADYYIQDAGSLLAVVLAQVQPTDKVCDLCAAPGGKASALLEKLDDRGILVANEPIASRVSILRHQLGRTGNPRYVVANQDPEQLQEPFDEYFDLIIVDAPCSGQTLTIKGKRNDDAFSAKQIEHSAQRQRRILRSAMSMLRVGGRLVYSTCTYADEENESQVDWMCEQFPGAFRPMPLDSLAAWQSPLGEACYRLWPHRHPCAGAFAARVLKTASIPSESSNRRSKSAQSTKLQRTRHRSGQTHQSAAMDPAALGQFKGIHMLGDEAHLRAISSDSPALDLLRSGRIGEEAFPLLANRKGDQLLPTQELAHLSSEYFQPQQALEVPDHVAKAIVTGQAIARSNDWQLEPVVCLTLWNGRGLGWMKPVGNRLNNMVPPIARLNIQ